MGRDAQPGGDENRKVASKGHFAVSYLLLSHPKCPKCMLPNNISSLLARAIAAIVFSWPNCCFKCFQ